MQEPRGQAGCCGSAPRKRRARPLPYSAIEHESTGQMLRSQILRQCSAVYF